MGLRLFVGNLSFNTDENALRDAFGAHGAITDVTIITDRETGRSRGFGFVTMADANGAKAAQAAMDGAQINGRALRVNEAEERGARGGGGGGGGGDRKRW
jgi:RNA recognition motif-containing protein